MTNLTIVPAGAGSGKTHRIQETLTQWVREGQVRPERILAVTFTEAAAGELRQRIRAALIADGNLAAALAVDRAYVSTIHGLGRRLLAEHAFADGASPSQRLIAEDEQDLLIRRAIEEDPALNALASDLGAYGYQSAFWSNDTAEDKFRGTLLGVIAHLRSLGPRGHDPVLVDCVEASVREGYGNPLGESPAHAARLKCAVDALLSAFPESLEDLFTVQAATTDFRNNFRELRRAQRLLAAGGKDWNQWQKLRKLRLSVGKCPTPEGYDDLAGAVMEAADALARHPGPLEDAVTHARALVAGAQAAMADYEARKRQLGVIDYSDMVVNAARLLRERPDVLASIMTGVDCVIVDEFQDTNPIQFTFLWTLAQQAPHALIVGDTKQAVMGFQGADPRLTTALTQQFATSPLTSNWRSDPRIMAFVNAVGPCLFGDGYTALTAQTKLGEATALEVIELAAKRGAHNNGKPQHFVADRVLSLLIDEAVTITDRHTRQVRALEAKDIAVLCPTHKQGAAYAAALRALGLPVRVAEAGWWQSKMVQAAAFALRYAVDPNDTHAALCLATLGPAAIPLDTALKVLVGGETLSTPGLAALAQLWPESLAMPVDRLTHAAIRAAGLRDWCDRLDDPAQMRADLLRFEAEASAFIEAHRDMREASGFYGQSAKVFLGWLENKISLKDEDKRPNPSGAEADGIEIVTWHGSKGREWPVVVVAGLDQKLDPRTNVFSTQFPDFDDLDHVIERATLSYAPDFAAPEATGRFLHPLRPEAEETARRLLYVALTRARERLIMEWPQSDDAKELPFPITARRLLDEHAQFRIVENRVEIGAQTFPARIVVCDKDLPGSFNAAAEPLQIGSARDPRFSITPRDVPDRIAVVSPSQALITLRPLPTKFETRQICPGVLITSSRLAHPAEKGIAIHEALRILLQRPDLKHHVAARCRCDEAEVEVIVIQAEALRQALAKLGHATLHIEQPLEIPLSDGGIQPAIIDLIAEGPEGYLIVDHKSGAVPDHAGRMAGYWPQLAAYADAVEAVAPKPVKAVAIFWTDTGELTMAIFSNAMADPS